MPIEVRRGQVLDAALRLILDQGYSAASMEAIAREADLAKPRVYTAYNGRALLLEALLRREENRVVRDLIVAMPAFTDENGFDETLVAAATNLLRAVADNPTSWRLLMLPADDAPPEIRTHVVAGRDFALANLRRLVDWGSGTRPGIRHLDPDLVARALLGIGEQAVGMVLTRPEEYTPERYEEFFRALLQLLQPDGRPHGATS